MKAVFIVSTIIISLSVFGGCADPGAQPATSAETEELTTACADPVFPRIWSSDFRGYWVGESRSMCVLYTATGDLRDDAFFAWGVADGARLGWLFKVNMRDFQSFQAHLNRDLQLAVDVAPQRFWCTGGGLGTGGPGGPIGPGGVPPDYLARILRSAGSLTDASQVTLDFTLPR